MSTANGEGRRSDVRGRNAVATSQPLAAQAGLQALRDAGNAVDAALAAAIALTVVETTMKKGVNKYLRYICDTACNLVTLPSEGPVIFVVPSYFTLSQAGKGREVPVWRIAL